MKIQNCAQFAYQILKIKQGLIVAPIYFVDFAFKNGIRLKSHVHAVEK